MLKRSIYFFSFLIVTSGCASKQSLNQSNLTQSNEKDIILSYEDYKKTYEKDEVQISQTPSTNISYETNVEDEDSLTDRIYIKQALMDFYHEWKHVKYKFGGSSKKGIDCSAFIQKAFRNKFSINIPRTTVYQVKKGQKISKSQLQAGDLVFFKSRKHGRHVGIYVGDNKFLHASIKGVKFSKLSKNYYKKNYWQSRRVLF